MTLQLRSNDSTKERRPRRPGLEKKKHEVVCSQRRHALPSPIGRCQIYEEVEKRYSTRVLGVPALGRISPAGRDDDAVLCEMFQLDGAWPTCSAGRVLYSGRSTRESFEKARLSMWDLMKFRGFCRSSCRLLRFLPESRLAWAEGATRSPRRVTRCARHSQTERRSRFQSLALVDD